MQFFIDRKKATEEIVTPLDIKLELILALVVLLFASVKTYMSSNDLKILSITHQYVNKTTE